MRLRMLIEIQGLPVLTQHRRQIKSPERAYSYFPPPLGTQPLYAGILIGLKDGFNTFLSDTFGQIFQVHIAPKPISANRSKRDFRFTLESRKGGCNAAMGQLTTVTMCA